MSSNVKQEKRYTLVEFLEFTASVKDNSQYELIDGYIYAMSPSPSVAHQRITGNLFGTLHEYFKGKPCEAFIAPLDVFLGDDNVFQPDIFVVCDKNKIKDDGCHGAPDFVIEVVSPSTSSRDYMYKLSNYFEYGVREYWIVNPSTKQVSVYSKTEEEMAVYTYTFDEAVKVSIFDDLTIDFNEVKPK